MKCAAFALLALVALAAVADARPYELTIPPGTNCNKSCYNIPGLLPSKKTLYALCGVTGVVWLDTTPYKTWVKNTPAAETCATYIYQRFPSPAAMVKYQNCEANQALYNRTMFAHKVAMGVNGRPTKFTKC